MEAVNLDACPESGLFYGGRAGQKVGILIDGQPWLAKYPRSTRDLRDRRLPAYTSSPGCAKPPSLGTRSSVCNILTNAPAR